MQKPDPTMRRLLVVFGATLTLFLALTALSFPGPARATGHAQQPTVAIATVTSTPSGPSIFVNPDQEQINVRAGPGTNYAKVGVLVSGQEAEAIGRSAQGLWIQIRYIGAPGGVGWVYTPLVRAPNETLPIIEPPPSPTPLVTPTIDPTLAAQFIVEAPPTRMPTFTAPPPLVVPTFVSVPRSTPTTGVPMGMVIAGLSVLGVLGFAVSILRGR